MEESQKLVADANSKVQQLEKAGPFGRAIGPCRRLSQLMEVGIPSPRMTAEHQGVYQGPTKSHAVTQVKAQLQGELKTKDEQLQKQAAKSRATAGVMYVD